MAPSPGRNTACEQAVPPAVPAGGSSFDIHCSTFDIPAPLQSRLVKNVIRHSLFDIRYSLFDIPALRTYPARRAVRAQWRRQGVGEFRKSRPGRGAKEWISPHGAANGRRVRARVLNP